MIDINFGNSKNKITRKEIIFINKKIFKHHFDTYFHNLLFSDFNESNKSEIKLEVPDTVVFKNIIKSYVENKNDNTNKRNQIVESLNEDTI